MAGVFAPLFRDPIHDGAADPTIIYNRQERTWWIVYTNRRANVDCRGVAWAHGTDIGVASSSDGGLSWCYRGILQGLEFEPGRNTFWAPEVLWHEDQYHMFVSYVPGVPHDWSGSRHILHYTSRDLWTWSFMQRLPLSSDRVIDACVMKMPSGLWRMWYKDEVHGSHTYAADSKDLSRWDVAGPVICDCAHEGPNVFRWKGFYWIITDQWEGLGVYRSGDAERWERQQNILQTGGNRPDDGTKGSHADVLVTGGRAFVLYFTHPGRTITVQAATVSDVQPYAERRSSLQMAELDLNDGVLACNRDAKVDLYLTDEDNWCEHPPAN